MEKKSLGQEGQYNFRFSQAEVIHGVTITAQMFS